MDRSVTDRRTDELLALHRSETFSRADRLFAGLLVAEWLSGIAVALWLSPRTWSGLDSRIHPHVLAAVLLGAVVALPSAALAFAMPGRTLTRHAVAVAQMAMGSLLIHLTGGRIETHFYIFGSLAFLSLYKEWGVLLTATVVVAGDHLVRGLLVPESVYGVLSASLWRTFEHAFWVVFEVGVLVYACVQAQREMRHIAERHSLLEGRSAVEAASEAKSEFLANMSHEIRTPMTAVQGYADLLLDPLLSPSDRLDYVQTIRRNSEHLVTIINDILDLSKIEAGKMEIENIACSPCQIVVDVASLMRVRAVDKNLDFEVRYLTPVPEVMVSDPTRLRQVLMNLVGNAIKFTRRGRVSMLVRCDEPGPDARIHFEVADTGIGLNKAGLSKLFQPFTQADTSTTRKYGGTGLGLTICQRLAGMLGGSIHVESLEGRGSSFTLSVSAGKLDGVRMIDGLEEAEMPTMPHALPSVLHLGCKVLLAEDGHDNQVLITTHLTKAGATVGVAENGRIAVDMALAALEAGAPFDVILMDMQMPELDGYAAASKLRSRGYTRPIVALTAHAMAGDRERCINAGCDDYLSKPVQRPVLLETVRRHAGSMAARTSPSDELLALPPLPEAAPPSRTSPAARSMDASPARPGPALAAVPSGDRSDEPIVSELADDPDMVAIVIGFVDSLPSRALSLRAAFDANDSSTLKRLAHQLKGAGGGFGFPCITDAAARVEDSARTASPSLTYHLDELIALCHRARPGKRKAAA